jgi:hypothetical protein
MATKRIAEEKWTTAWLIAGIGLDLADPIFCKFSAHIGNIIAVPAQCESVQNRKITAENLVFSMRMQCEANIKNLAFNPTSPVDLPSSVSEESRAGARRLRTVNRLNAQGNPVA